MSYILDALKKSEGERRSGGTAAIAFGATYSLAPAREAGSRAATVVAALAMLAVGMALGAWHPWQPRAGQVRAAELPPRPITRVATLEPPPGEVAHPPVSVSPPESPRLRAATELPVRKAPVPARKAPPRRPAPAGNVALSPFREAPAGVVAYRDLPAEVRRNLPRIDFGGYAGADGVEGVAFINRRLVKVGEEVSPGVRLERVSPDEVVLDYQRYRFTP